MALSRYLVIATPRYCGSSNEPGLTWFLMKAYFFIKSDFEFPEAHENANNIDWRMSHLCETLRANKKCNLPSRENQTSKHLQEQIKFSETIFFRTKENYTAFKSSLTTSENHPKKKKVFKQLLKVLALPRLAALKRLRVRQVI